MNNKQNHNLKNNISLIKLGTVFAMLFMLFTPTTAYSQGLIVPASSSMKVNSGSLIVPGDISNAGTISTTSGTVALTGAWDFSAGTYTPGNGTLEFYGSGAQTFNPLALTFWNVSHTGTGNLTLSTNSLDIDGNFSNSNGAFITSNLDINVAGNWSNTDTFTPGTGTVTFDGWAQSISGATTFYDFEKSIPDATQQASEANRTLTFENGQEQIISNSVTLQGFNADNLLLLRSDSEDDEWQINLQAGGLQTLTYLDVQDSNATGLHMAAGSTSTNSGGNNNWSFGAATITWDGDTDNDWDEASNWNIGVVPTAGDSVIIPDVSGGSGNFPVLNVAAVTVANLTIQDDANFNLDGNSLTTTSDLTLSGANSELTVDGGNLTVTGVLYNTGTIILDGNEATVSIGTVDVDSGTFEFVGNADANSGDTFTLPNLDSDDANNLDIDYYNVIINSTVNIDNFDTDGVIVVGGDLTVTSGALDIAVNSENDMSVLGDLSVDGANGVFNAENGGNSASLDVNGDVSISNGIFVAPDGGETFILAGDFAHSGGTFTHSSGTLTLDGGDQSINGSSTFYGLNKTLTAGPSLTLTFENSTEQIITGSLVLQGFDNSNLLELNSDDDDGTPTQFQITLQAGGTQTLSYLGVKNSDAQTGGGVELVARDSSVNRGNNLNWAFGGTTITWQGDVVGSETDWDTPGNWDLGLVPNEDDSVEIPGAAANDPTLASNVQVENLTIENGATVSIEGFDLTVDTTLSNEGTISLWGTTTQTLNYTQDVDSGTYIYEGNDGAAEDIRSIYEFGTVDYYNLEINDSGATKDIFRTSTDLTVDGTLNVTAGELDISENKNTLTVTGTLTVDGGTLRATEGNIDANGSVSISAGELVSPEDGQSFTIADDFSHTAGTFTHSGGEVTFDTVNTATITGDTSFYDFTSTVNTKTIEFAAGSTQEINGTFTITGESTLEVALKSTVDNTQWNLTSPNGNQSVQFVNLRDSNSDENDFVCFTCIDSGGNDDSDPSPHWVFLSLGIEIPEDNEEVDTTPTIIGTSDPGNTVVIKDKNGDTVATTVADSSGGFMVEVTTPLDKGSNSLTPNILGVASVPTNITVVVNPTFSQVSTITSHVDGQRVHGATPTVKGRGEPGQSVSIRATDEDGNLVLQEVGTGTVDNTGRYSIELSTSLPKGVNYISTVVGGVGSDIVDVLLTDPFGVVFDSVSDGLIENAVVSIYRTNTNPPELAVAGVDLHADDVNPYTTGSDGFYNFLAADGDYYITVEAEGFTYPSQKTSFPDDRTIVDGSKGEEFTVASVVIEMDQPADADTDVIRIVKDANKAEAHIGEVVTYTIGIESRVDTVLTDVYIEDKIPPGFKYLENRVTLDGLPIDDPTGRRPLSFKLGNLSAGQVMTLKYQLVVGSGVTPGDYNNTAFAKYQVGTRLSNYATETVKVILDPLFDLGTVIGKVFFDKNENGVQDEPEYFYMDRDTITEDPVPNVKIVMEDGTVITTDKNGQFSVPALSPGRHLLRLDERSLPDGSYLTTDKVVIIDVTPGLLVKVNFGVNLDYGKFKAQDKEFFDSEVNITQDRNRPEPRLNVSLFRDEIVIFNNYFVNNAEFRIFANYSPFIEYWKLEILDEDTKRIIKTFEGNRYNLLDPIFWDGTNNKGEYIRIDRNYIYRLLVEDHKGQYDETKSKEIKFNIIEDEDELEEYKEKMNADRSNYSSWTESENKKDNLFVQNIHLDGETIYVDKLTSEMQNIQIMKDGKLLAEVPVAQKHGLTAKELLDSIESHEEEQDNKFDIILPKGEYELLIQKTKDTIGAKETGGIKVIQGEGKSKEILSKPIKTYSKEINIGEDYLFFVGLGDAKMGYTISKGDIEPVAHDDKYKEGFWSEGKLAYYLKGKVLGRYLITSSYDSERDKKELFRNLDEDTYYPVYGDSSSIDYEATNTQGNLYLMIEWDKSSVQWSNYSIAFDDTEFAKFSRTLYGGKIDFETLSTTKFGDPKTKVVAFRARAQQKSAHNELLATGGSLYYLKHQDIIEGSEKVKVEVRDKITGLVISEKELKEGADFEMDYDNGRMLFWRPVPMIVESFSIISDELLDGNLVYVIADYEYDVKDKFDQANRGIRMKQAIGDYTTIGGTYVRENLETSDYKLMGTDVTVRIGKDSKITAEYAETESQVQGNFISTDGGLSFTEIDTDDSSRGKAYGIKGDVQLFNNQLGLASYYKWIDNDFSTSATTAQQGKELIGFEVTYDISDDTRLKAVHDIQSLIDQGNLQTKMQVGATKTATSLIQFIHEVKDLKITGEYKRKEVTERDENFASKTNVEENAFALQADYKVNEDVELMLKQQISINEGVDHQTTVGISAKPTEDLTLTAKESFGSDGTSTALGITSDVSDKLSLSGEYAITSDKEGKITNKATVGAEAKVNDQTNIKTSFGMTGSGESSSMVSIGTSADVDEDTTVDGEVALTTSAKDQATTLSVGGSKQIDEKTKTESKVSLTDSSADGQTTAFTFGTKRKLNDEFELASTRTFGSSEDKETLENTYGLIRQKDGRKLEGSYSRKYSEDVKEVSRSNIFGLTGDIDDKWAFDGSYERGDVQNLDGSELTRDVLSLGLGYVNDNPETGELLKSSTKLEARLDDGDENKVQYLAYNATEGKLTPELTVFTKLEYSKTRNRTSDITEAEHREMEIGTAYRPIMNDRLNLLSKYTYLENKSPSGQEKTGSDVIEDRAQVLSAEGIFDIDDHWQISEKFAYRILEEKVEGFSFTKTHTWLIINRLNYKIDKNWSIGGEFRILKQEEAKDIKKGLLIEAARRVGDYAQLGVGYNFTDFNDDLTELDYSAHGPFVRLTGKFYDQTPEEKERARNIWLEEKINRWAWMIVNEELSKDDSPILAELNHYFILAQEEYNKGEFMKSHQIYKDIIIASQMMIDEASEYIRGRISMEEKLKEMSDLADQYFDNGQYEKARKILEKLVEEAHKGMIEWTK